MDAPLATAAVAGDHVASRVVRRATDAVHGHEVHLRRLCWCQRSRGEERGHVVDVEGLDPLWLAQRDSSSAVVDLAHFSSPGRTDTMESAHQICLVTVGSTEFQGLVDAALSMPTQAALVALGVSRLVVQYGNSRLPKFETTNGMDIELWRFKDGIEALVEQADLVISHAGPSPELVPAVELAFQESQSSLE